MTNEFCRGNGEDYNAMNAIWKKVNECFRPYKSSLDARACTIIRQRIFIVLCREYLRIRSHPKRECDVSIESFLKFGTKQIEKVCKAKAENYKSFQQEIVTRINAKYDEKIREYKMSKLKNEDAAFRYEYVYAPGNN